MNAVRRIYFKLDVKPKLTAHFSGCTCVALIAVRRTSTYSNNEFLITTADPDHVTDNRMRGASKNSREVS